MKFFFTLSTIIVGFLHSNKLPAQNIFKDSTKNTIWLVAQKLDNSESWVFEDKIRLKSIGTDTVKYHLERSLIGTNSNLKNISASFQLTEVKNKIWCKGQITRQRYLKLDTITINYHLLYDFNLTQFDTFIYVIDKNHDSIIYIIDSIGTVTLENGKKVNAQFFGDKEYYNAFEIGSKRGGILGFLNLLMFSEYSAYMQYLISACHKQEILICDPRLNQIPQNSCCESDSMAIIWHDFYADVHELSIEKLIFYPNPCANILHVEPNQMYSYKILDLTGKVVNFGTIHNGILDLQNLSSGIYFVNLCNQNIVHKIKVLRE